MCWSLYKLNTFARNAHQSIMILQTKRLLLRPTKDSDTAELHQAIFSDADVMKYLPGGKAISLDESMIFVKDKLVVGGENIGLGSLVEKATGSVIGFAGLLKCFFLQKEDVELGYVLAKSSWGVGYATEIGRAQMRYGFNELHCERLLASVHSENIGSIRVLKKLGLTFVKNIEIQDRGKRDIYVVEK